MESFRITGVQVKMGLQRTRIQRYTNSDTVMNTWNLHGRVQQIKEQRNVALLANERIGLDLFNRKSFINTEEIR